MNELIFDYARSPMIVSDSQGIVLRVNRAVIELFGYSQVSHQHMKAWTDRLSLVGLRGICLLVTAHSVGKSLKA